MGSSTGSAASKRSSSDVSNASINKPVAQEWKRAEEIEVEMTFTIQINELLKEFNSTQEGTECKYSRVKKFIKKKVIQVFSFFKFLNNLKV